MVLTTFTKRKREIGNLQLGKGVTNAKLLHLSFPRTPLVRLDAMISLNSIVHD